MKLFVLNKALLALLFGFAAISAFAQDTGGVKGKVQTEKGRAIADATVYARQDGKNIKSAVTNAKGQFLIEGLKVGVYNLLFEKKGYAAATLYNIQVEKKKIRDLSGKNLIMTIDQGTLVIIKGSVFNQAGYSIYGAKVEIFRFLEGGKTKKVGEDITSESGEFTFRFPEEPAKFLITATIKGVSESKEIAVDSALIYRLALTLKQE